MFVLGPCFVMQYFVSFQVGFSAVVFPDHTHFFITIKHKSKYVDIKFIITSLINIRKRQYEVRKTTKTMNR